MTHIIAEPCIGVKDTACIDVCPVDCIYGKHDGWEMLYIHPEECIDCGLCVDACPVQAIYPLEDVPEKWHSFIARNFEQFGFQAPWRRTGRPTGASRRPQIRGSNELE